MSCANVKCICSSGRCWNGLCAPCKDAGCGDTAINVPCQLPTARPLFSPVSIVLMQPSPGSWTVEVTLDGKYRYAKAGCGTRRFALDAAIQWIEREEQENK